MSPKACAEELGYTFLPCVLAYLHRAPFLVRRTVDTVSDLQLTAEHVDIVVAPVRRGMG